MKIIPSLKTITALAFSAALASFALAHEGHHQKAADSAISGSLIKADAAHVSADWLAKAKASYPLDACPVSDDKLEGGDMGPPQDYIYRQNGKSDRLVRLCCNDCVKDFNQDPATYLRKIDDATKAKTASSK